MKNQTWPKRDLNKNYFPVPNEVFLLNLTPGELAVYCYLLFRENRQTYQCWPSYKRIGEAVGMSPGWACSETRSEISGYLEKVARAGRSVISHR